MLRPRHHERISVGTVVLVVVVIAGILGWALYDNQQNVPVRKVPTETITVPK